MTTPAIIEDKIVRARIRMLLKAPFFGTLALRLELKDATSWIPTAATDGKYLYYNVNFFQDLDKKEIEFVVAHEILHVTYEHMSRRGGRDPRLWNCAGDFVINYDLHEQRIGKFPSKCEILFDTKYKGMCAEEIYEKLKEDAENGKGQGMDSFDVHLDDEDNKGDGREPLTDEEKKILRDEFTKAVLDAAKVAGNEQVPGSVKKMIKDLTEPKMDWREIINTHILSSFKSDFTFSVPNRKGWSQGIVLPGMMPDERMEVYIALDTSGSISHDMLRDFLSEVQGAMEQFSDFVIKLWTFDTAVYNLQEFTPENIDDFLDYEIMGNGGTNFMVNWEFMKENDFVPNCFLMMTDGMPFSDWGDPNYCDTIFLIHGSTTIEAPFGTTCYYSVD